MGFGADLAQDTTKTENKGANLAGRNLETIILNRTVLRDFFFNIINESKIIMYVRTFEIINVKSKHFWCIINSTFAKSIFDKNNFN